MKKFFYLLFLFVLLFTSCSPQKRLQTLLNNHPYLLSADTVYKSDTIIKKVHSLDTGIKTNQKDTLFFSNEVRDLQIIRSYDTLYINEKFNNDTIIVEKTIIKEKLIGKKDRKDIYFYFIIIILFIIFIIKK